MANATSAVGMREADRDLADSPLPARARDQVQHGQQRGRAGLLGQRGEPRSRRRRAKPRPRRANRTAAVIDGSMNTSKFAAWPSCGANATIASTNSMPAIHPARAPYRRRRLDREQQRGERHREHRDDAHRPQRGGLEERERGRVHVRHERWLAVGRVLVELPPSLITCAWVARNVSSELNTGAKNAGSRSTKVSASRTRKIRMRSRRSAPPTRGPRRRARLRGRGPRGRGRRLHGM